MHITIVSATFFEIQHFLDHYEIDVENIGPLTINDHRVDILITGVGMIAMTYSMTKYLQYHTPDIMLNVGIGGGFSSRLHIGNVVQVCSEVMMDLGFEQADQSFQSIFSSELISKNQSPFTEGRLINQHEILPDIPLAKGGTVQRVLGSIDTIKEMKKHWSVDVVNMEGAAFFYVLMSENKNIIFHQVRAISNRVSERNKEEWNIALAVESLNTLLLRIIDGMLA